MMRHLSRMISLLALLSISMYAPAQDHAYALTNANVFNGNRDRIFADRTVFVSGGKIERIAPGDEAIPSGYEVIDC